MTTPFSFHCMICFEGFDETERYPVVLPCGHTYVCAICADRLDKCMECRTSLWVTTTQQPPNASMGVVVAASGQKTSPLRPSPAWSSRRSSLPNTPTPLAAGNRRPRPQQVERKRLPTPKNVVLLSLMDTAVPVDNIRKEGEISKGDLSPALADEDEDEDDEVNFCEGSFSCIESSASVEAEKIKFGTELALGECGTYVVTAREGLHILPLTSSSTDHSSLSEFPMEQNVDDIVTGFHHTQQNQNPRSKSPNSIDGGIQVKYGDRLQIVCIDHEEGWARVARGYGRVRADAASLVKVGGFMDRACKIEAMLHTLTTKRKSVHEEEMRLANLFTTLMKELEESLRNDDDLTVTVLDAFLPSLPMPLENDDVENDDDEARASPVQDQEVTTPSRPLGSLSNMEQPALRMRKSSSQSSMDVDTGYGCFPKQAVTVCQSFSMSGSGDSNNSPRATAFVRAPLTPPNTDGSYSSPSLYQSSTYPSPTVMSDGGRSLLRLRSSDRSHHNGVDFRTGLSGHMALLSSHRHPFEQRRYHRPMMSSHSGLSFTKTKGVARQPKVENDND